MSQNSFINEIENEYKKIDHKWLHLQYNTSVGLVAFGFIVECILELMLYKSGSITIGLEKYLFKYLLTPFVGNSLCVVVGHWTMHSGHIKQKIKIYIVSLLFVMICFVLFTVHSIFSSLFLIFTLPILLTVVYGDHFLTTITAAASIFAYTVSDVFVVWDTEKPAVFASYFTGIDFIASLCILCAFYAACIVVIRFEREKNSACVQKEIDRLLLQQKLLIDELTAINNRTALRDAIDQMVNDNVENTYIFVMSDLDNFKMLNDKYGHSKGDQCLKHFASILKTNCDDGTPFRFGGDEFCMIFKNKTEETVIKICNRIQRDFKVYLSGALIDIPLTASFGIANYNYKTEVSELLKNADVALYRSKETKNAIHIYNEKFDQPIVKAQRDDLSNGMQSEQI